MANYISDRAFTDHIHNNVAIPVIYNPINWAQVNLDPDDAVHARYFLALLHQSSSKKSSQQ